MTTTEILDILMSEKNKRIYAGYLYGCGKGVDVEIGGLKIIGADAKGGYEGGGDYVERVFKIGEQHYKVVGHYDSDNGIDFLSDQLQEVNPRQVMITIYE